MFNSTIRAPGRFLRIRFLLPVVLFLLVVRFSFLGGGDSNLSQWSFFRYSNETLKHVELEPIPENRYTEPLDHDRDGKSAVPEQKSVVGDGQADQAEVEKSHHGDQAIIQEEHEHVDNVCGDVGGGDRIVITLNTGATEVLDRVPTQLQTSLLCVKNIYIFSDLGHMLGDHQVYDSLDTIPASVMDGNSDFDLYRKQLELKDPVRVASFLKGMKDPRASDVQAAWTLDKYKKLHILEKVWDLKPDMDWYLHIDADTYVVWSTLVAWLEKLDPTKESYLGSLSFINNLPFAHGGSGMLMSGAAMRNFAIVHSGTAGRWDYKMHDECCSDWVLAQILKEYGMELMNSWPTIQGEALSTIPFDSSHWCQPLATMHHVSPLEAAQLGDFEANRKNKTIPLTFAELFTGLMSDLIPEDLDDWDNQPRGETRTDITSADDCVNSCKSNSNCLQSLFTGDECILGTEHIALGVKHQEEDGKKWQSFWNKARIAEWVGKNPCDDPIQFPYEGE